MTNMVSELRHVVSGQRGGGWGQHGTSIRGAVTSSFGGVYSPSPSPPLSSYSSSSGSGFASASGSSSWSGQKRGREDEGATQLIDSIPRGFRGSGFVDHFRASQGGGDRESTASGVTGKFESNLLAAFHSYFSIIIWCSTTFFLDLISNCLIIFNHLKNNA